MKIDRAVKLQPGNSEYLTEAAYQYLLFADYDNALKLYSEASKLDEGNVHALLGAIRYSN